MISQEILKSLNQLEENLDSLTSILRKKKEALIANDYVQIEQLISKEQKMLQLIGSEEKKRKALIQNFADANSLKIQAASLTELLTKGKDYFTADMKKIDSLRSSVRKKAIDVSDLNAQLTNLIQYSRGYVKDLIMMIFGQNKRALVNKRV